MQAIKFIIFLLVGLTACQQTMYANGNQFEPYISDDVKNSYIAQLTKEGLENYYTGAPAQKRWEFYTGPRYYQGLAGYWFDRSLDWLRRRLFGFKYSKPSPSESLEPLRVQREKQAARPHQPPMLPLALPPQATPPASPEIAPRMTSSTVSTAVQTEPISASPSITAPSTPHVYLASPVMTTMSSPSSFLQIDTSPVSSPQPSPAYEPSSFGYPESIEAEGDWEKAYTSYKEPITEELAKFGAENPFKSTRVITPKTEEELAQDRKRQQAALDILQSAEDNPFADPQFPLSNFEDNQWNI